MIPEDLLKECERLDVEKRQREDAALEDYRKARLDECFEQYKDTFPISKEGLKIKLGDILFTPYPCGVEFGGKISYALRYGSYQVYDKPSLFKLVSALKDASITPSGDKRKWWQFWKR